MNKFFKYPLVIIVVIFVITTFFALQLPNAHLDNNNFRFVPQDNPARLISAKIDEEFGSSIFIMVGLERQYGTIFDSEFLSTLKEYEEKIGELPVVDTVTSIISSDYIGGSDEGIIVEPLVPETFSGSKSEIDLLKQRLLEWDLYRNALVSDDFTSTQILVSLDISSDNAGSPESVDTFIKIKRIAYESGFKNTRIYVTGLPVFSAVINEATRADLAVLIPLVAIAVILVLFLSFKRLDGIFLPLLTVAVSAIWSIGAMALFEVRLSIISTVLPVILVAVGSAYGIHVISHYYDEMADSSGMSDDAHRQLIYSVLGRVGRPVFLAALTTFAGFGSLCFTSVVPIFEFGLFASFGVVIALLVSLTLIPALLILKGPRTVLHKKDNTAESGSHNDLFSNIITDTFSALAQKKLFILLLSIIVIVISVAGLKRLVIDNVMVEYFKPDTDIVQSDEFIRKHFGGSKTLSLVVRSKERGDVLHPDVLAAMDGLSDYLAEYVPEVGKTMSFTDLVKRINQVYNADESPEGISGVHTAYYPETPVSVEQENPGFGFDEPAIPGFGFGSAPSPKKTGTENTEHPLSAAMNESDDSGTPSLSEKELLVLLTEAIAEGGRNISADELVKQIARKTNYRGMAYYEIPEDLHKYGKSGPEELKSLVSNYLVLLSGNIDAFANDPLEPTAIRMNLQLRTIGESDTGRAVSAIRNYVANNFPDNVETEIGGIALVEGSLNRLVVQSQLSSVFVSLILVFLILSVYYRSAVAGFIGLASLGLSILVNFAVMGFFGIKLNIGTAMVASIAVGVGIDYIIHYMASYHYEWLAGFRGQELLRRTCKNSGRAIIFNAASVGAGFAVLVLSQFSILAYLGVLISLTMATSALVSLTLLPVLLSLINPGFIRNPLPFEKNKHIEEESK